MRSKRRKVTYPIKRHWLYISLVLMIFVFVFANCTLDNGSAVNDYSSSAETGNAAGGFAKAALTDSDQLDVLSAVLSEQLWADVGIGTTTPRPDYKVPDVISLDVRDANLLDVLSLLAHKIGVNIIFLEQPTQITIKTENLSPETTFQTVLQKEGLDYLTIGRNYIVGQRNRLYADFANRMLLTRYSLFYVSAAAMEGYISELGVPVETLTVDQNQQALWMQGTPMTLGKARELINALDIMENAAFAEGGARKIRMPVASATGPRAEEELEALIDLLSVLLDGYRDGRIEMGWVTWDHPDPIPYITMDWESPVIKPHDIRMKITRDFANDYGSQIRFLIAEGKPANIELVNQMIAAIASTPTSPISLAQETEPQPVSNIEMQWTPSPSSPPSPQGGNISYYTVSTNAVPSVAGSLSGSGSYAQGSWVTVTANAAEAYQFVRWIDSGAEVSTNPSYSFSIYGNRSLEAVFIKLPGYLDSEIAEED